MGNRPTCNCFREYQGAGDLATDTIGLRVTEVFTEAVVFCSICGPAIEFVTGAAICGLFVTAAQIQFKAEGVDQPTQEQMWVRVQALADRLPGLVRDRLALGTMHGTPTDGRPH